MDFLVYLRWKGGDGVAAYGNTKHRHDMAINGRRRTIRLIHVGTIWGVGTPIVGLPPYAMLLAPYRGNAFAR